ncbi:hypothetical protein CISG_05721 [Coccidioides immitis RMSCC 3703]|uniref:Uncharacterized protein n=2 Tax=Coccidioides immitis TaxID=5501 RepID=A0A0J8TS63_COCIT|nr:hypothetical protein CIRG_05669 [Coccidioides immitis RMSCC 2394]KMU76577.1 hypothetical protein CISG_05721 [Coccidioides immitis RMSCC 3703]
MAAAITINVAVTPQRGVSLEHSIFRPDEPRSLFALFVIFDGLSNIVTGRGFCRGPPWFPLLFGPLVGGRMDAESSLMAGLDNADHAKASTEYSTLILNGYGFGFGSDRISFAG